ncbi:hypothetical protein Pmar_PMAR013356, partial [Perkinsus marinus ATCC 50983]
EIEKVDNIPPNDREKLPDPKERTKAITERARILESHVVIACGDCPTVEKISKVVYAAASVLLREQGVKQPARSKKRGKLPAKRRLEDKLKTIRRDLGRVTSYLQQFDKPTRRLKTVTKEIRQQFGNSKTALQNAQGRLILQLKQVSAKLRIWTTKEKRVRLERLMKSNQKQLYREIQVLQQKSPNDLANDNSCIDEQVNNIRDNEGTTHLLPKPLKNGQNRTPGSDNYNYLGIPQNLLPDKEEVSRNVENILHKRIKVILEAKLSAVDTIRALNTWAIPVVYYPIQAGLLGKKIVVKLDSTIRNALRKYFAHGYISNTELLYVSRKEGGRGLTNIEDVWKKFSVFISQYIKDNIINVIPNIKTTNPLCKIIRRADKIKTQLGVERGPSVGVQ